MLREVVNAVVLTFVVSEWLSEKPGRRLVLFARRDASTKALCAALGSALLIVNFVGDHVPALGGLLASNAVVAIVEGAVLAAGAYGTAKITRRPCLCGVPTFKKGDVDKSAFLRAFAVCTILCYVQGGMAFAHVYVPRAVVAAAAFVAVLYVDVRRTVDVNLTTFGKELGRACAYVAPMYPLLAILCSLIFVPIMSLFEKAGWNLRRLDAPIFYTVFYGPFSAVYVFAKRALLDSRYGLPVSASRRAGAAAVAREMSKLLCCIYCRGVLTVRASTDSSSDSDSVTRWWTHSSATESYSFFLEPSRSTRSRVTTLWSEIDARIRAVDAGGIRAYERLHRTTLANILNRGNRLPADVIPKIVDFWAHVGWYAIEHDRPWNN